MRCTLYLAESHEIETFLINKALGMSMRYGLKASLFAIEESFRRKLSQKRALGAPIYQRILYCDEYGAALVDTTPRTSLPPLPQRGDSEVQLVIDGKQGQIIVSAPVNYRGSSDGTVITVADTALLSRYLTPSANDVGSRQLLITKAGRELVAAGKSSVQRRTH